MLDGCGIETVGGRSACRSRQRVAIDARWLWNRDVTLPSTFVSRAGTSRSMLDGCGIETSRGPLRWARRLSGRDRCSMAVESRHARAAPSARDPERRDRCSMAVESRPTLQPFGAHRVRGSRSMLDGCGIETTPGGKANHGGARVAIDARWLWNRDRPARLVPGRLESSRSMLDGCGIETIA